MLENVQHQMGRFFFLFFFLFMCRYRFGCRQVAIDKNHDVAIFTASQKEETTVSMTTSLTIALVSLLRPSVALKQSGVPLCLLNEQSVIRESARHSSGSDEY